MKKVIFMLTLIALASSFSEVLAQGKEATKVPVVYIVKSVVAADYVTQFDEWYHKKHIPEFIKLSGCNTGRRYKATIQEDKFMYMAVYEFPDAQTFQKYQNSEDKKYLIKDFKDRFGDKAELRASAWEQIYP
jgi:antibiotic biosynthesis monooxygenase (ABM) superfamily enzyme